MDIVIAFSGLAWVIIPRVIHGFNSDANISWRVFSCVCAIPAVISAISFGFLPESPKYLLIAKGDREALAVLKHIYKVNHPNETRPYPVS